MKRSKIIGVGSYVPPHVVTNHDLEKMLNTNDEWITQRTGIKERRWVNDGESTTDLALIAAKNALEHAQIDKSELDMIIFATISPDHEIPGAGCFLQAKLDVPGIPTLDVKQQCSGFIYATSIADMYIRSGDYKKILVIGAEVHSKGMNRTPEGRDISILFGDGAGAVIMSATDVNDPKVDSHIISTHLHADGSFAKDLWIPGPGSGIHKTERITKDLLDEGVQYPYMNGKKVFAHAVKRMCEITTHCVNTNGFDVNDVDIYFFHQANLRINEATGQRTGIIPEKIYNTIQRYANTTAATIPLGMDSAIKDGSLKKGMLVGMTAFGSGFTWCSSLMRF